MTYAAEVLADTPLVYWRLGEASGTTAADASGNSHPGTYISSPQLGVTGLLDGDGDTAIRIAALATNRRVQSAATVHAAGTIAMFAIECLAEISGSTNNGDNLVQIGDPAGASPDFINLGHAAADSAVSFYFLGTSGFSSVAAVVSSGVHHIVGEFTGTRLKIYVDGELAAYTDFVDDGAVLSVASSLGVPYASAGAANSNSHVIDEAAFYTHTLGAIRVAAHATAAGFTPTPPALPVVDSLTPSTGPVAGSTEVIIAGTFLTDALNVDFGASAASFTVDDDTQITAQAPAHAAGTVQVVVTTAVGSSG